jgi:SAM-dependent methyltransferase
MVEDRLAKGKQNAPALGLDNLDFQLGRADALPVSAASVDVVITNGVFHLCLDKPKVVADMFRVLQPGGRLQMADILLEERAATDDRHWLVRPWDGNGERLRMSVGLCHASDPPVGRGDGVGHPGGLSGGRDQQPAVL